MIIITRQIEASKSRQISKECQKKTTDLNSILAEWKFDNKEIKSAQEFLSKFKPWIKEQLTNKQKLKAFLERKGVNDLEELE